MSKCPHCKVVNQGVPCTYCGEQLAIAARWDKPYCNCELCGRITMMTGTCKCDRCWELVTRIEGDRELAFKVVAALISGMTGAEIERHRENLSALSTAMKEADDYVVQNLKNNRKLGSTAAEGSKARQEE
jgi:hypothetical protein